MNIMTDDELARKNKLAFLAGAVTAIAAIALTATAAAAIYYQVFGFLNPPLAAPEIVLQTPSKTVARIPTQHAGVRVDCTVTIDQAKNVWSITC